LSPSRTWWVQAIWNQVLQFTLVRWGVRRWGQVRRRPRAGRGAPPSRCVAAEIARRPTREHGQGEEGGHGAGSGVGGNHCRGSHGSLAAGHEPRRGGRGDGNAVSPPPTAGVDPRRPPIHPRRYAVVVDPALNANGVYPRQKTQHRMRIATPESQRERRDHWARSAQKRRKQRKRNDDIFEHAR